MGKLSCFYIFGRKMKATKLTLDEKPAQQSKDMIDSCDFVEKTLKMSAPGVDLPYSPETKGSKDTSVEPIICNSNKMQATSSPDSQLDVHLVRNESRELVKPAEICERNDDLSSCSLHAPNIYMSEAASVSVNEAALRGDDDSQGLYSIKSCPDSHVEGADVSEDSSGGLDSASNSPSCEDFSRPVGQIASLDAHRPEYFGSGNQFIPVSQRYSMDSLRHPNNVIASCYEVKVVGRGNEILYSPDTAILPSNMSDRTLPDDEILTGHISDPGIYDRDEPQSMFKSSAFLSNSIIAPVDNKVVFLRKSESDPYICKLLPSEGNVENMSAEIGEHASSPTEPTFCSADKVTLKLESSSKVLDSNKRHSWWKIFMVSHRNIHLEGLKQASDTVAFGGEIIGKPPNPVTGYTSDICDMGQFSENDDASRDALVTTEKEYLGKAVFTGNHSEHRQVDALELGMQASYEKALGPSNEWVACSTAESGLSRVEEWIQNIQQSDASIEEEIALESERLSNEICIEEVCAVASTTQKTVGPVSIDAELTNAAIRSLNPFSTVAHIAGIGLREVPSLGLFNSLKTINLSANKIVRIPPGCLPRSLHVLDLSKNQIGVIEGFRELTRLRVLNLSYNRIIRIGHGLANCTLIKELYLAGNKLAEVEGLHRLLKLSILDISFNKLTTSKGLGQLAANYSSLLALNLLGNPVHVNIGEEQLRKIVVSITPHVTYLNKQPIKAVPAREAVVDSVARAALGSSQRNSKSTGSRASRRLAETRSTHQPNKSYSHRSKNVERRRAPLAPEFELLNPARLPTPHHPHRQQIDGRQTAKGAGKEHRHSSRAPMSVHEHFLQKIAMDTEFRGMHRSRSESALQD